MLSRLHASENPGHCLPVASSKPGNWRPHFSSLLSACQFLLGVRMSDDNSSACATSVRNLLVIGSVLILVPAHISTPCSPVSARPAAASVQSLLSRSSRSFSLRLSSRPNPRLRIAFQSFRFFLTAEVLPDLGNNNPPSSFFQERGPPLALHTPPKSVLGHN
jgi:hypothetical protein